MKNIFFCAYPCSLYQKIYLQRESLLNKLKNSLIKTRDRLGNEIAELFRNKKIDENLLKSIEEQLILADVGFDLTYSIIEKLKKNVRINKIDNVAYLYEKLRQDMKSILDMVNQPLVLRKNANPFVIIVVGVNGVGKTTVIGKLSYKFKTEGYNVMMAAGDTFRAAAVEQLQEWGFSNGVPVIARGTGADSASVIFDSLKTAKKHQSDVLLVDTAGRLQNKLYLMKELKKIIKVIKRIDIEAPHEIMLVIDAGIGQNSIQQVNLFNESIGITGLVMTKLDGTAKGGVIFGIADKFKIPVRYVSIGEEVEDLQIFNVVNFIDAIFPMDFYY